MRDSNQLWDKSIQLLLVMIVGFNLIPHTLYLPPWVTAVTGSALIWKTLILLRGYQKPQRWLVLSITVAGTIGILLSYHTIIGQEPASALLVMLASLKLLETNRYRDAMLVTFVSYFLLMAHLLNSQSLLSTMYMALDVLLITTLMFHLHKRDRRTSARSFRPVMKMLAATLPVWVFLFIAFPRFSTGLWHLEHPAAQGTGFSDSLSPGSVDKLIDSDELAFRVDFDRSSNPRLNPESLYWRGAILTESHGLEWRKLTISPTASGQKGAEKDPLKDVVEVPDLAAREAFSYQIFLEPIFHEWLFALDFPRDVTMNDPVLQKYARTQPGFTFGLNQPITSRFVYTGHSTLVSPPLILQDRQAYLQIPLEMSPRVVELARTLKAGTHNSEEASRHILKYFDDKNFRYTHTPGRIPAGQDQLDFFLFTSRRGFCEHFAGAYSSLMRLMGYPARVVIGFQGGRMNEFGKYMSVRSLDAHAWSEIWREDSRRQNHGRWIRVDPTETIAPMRLLLGGDYNRLDAAQLAQGLTKEELRDHLEGDWLHFNLKAAMAWDAMQMKWNSFLLLYDFNYQLELLDKIGVKAASRWIFLLWVTLGLFIFFGSMYWWFRYRAGYQDPLLISWRNFCKTLERAGITRMQNEGPLRYAERALETRPDFELKTAQEIRAITDAFIELRYGQMKSDPADAGQSLRRFRQSVRRFSIRTSSRALKS